MHSPQYAAQYTCHRHTSFTSCTWISFVCLNPLYIIMSKSVMKVVTTCSSASTSFLRPFTFLWVPHFTQILITFPPLKMGFANLVGWKNLHSNLYLQYHLLKYRHFVPSFPTLRVSSLDDSSFALLFLNSLISSSILLIALAFVVMISSRIF
jgi:hypothetical protein